METIELESLLGKHYLSGVDFDNESVKEKWSDRFEDCQAIRFILDGDTYTATEDPSDGYRSCMRYLIKTDHKIRNTFPAVMVFGIKKPRDWHENNTVQFYDVETGKLVLEVGTDNFDDYYPSFVGRFYPENLIHNQSSW
jgi:hypothetical protein